MNDYLWIALCLVASIGIALLFFGWFVFCDVLEEKVKDDLLSTAVFISPLILAIIAFTIIGLIKGPDPQQEETEQMAQTENHTLDEIRLQKDLRRMVLNYHEGVLGEEEIIDVIRDYERLYGPVERDD